MDMDELRVTLDRTDDLTHEQVFDILISDLRKQGVPFTIPAEPLTDKDFIGLLIKSYDHGVPSIFPPEPEDLVAA